MTECPQILEPIGKLQPDGMRAARDEFVKAGVKRNQCVEQVTDTLLQTRTRPSGRARVEDTLRNGNDQERLTKLSLVEEMSDLAFDGWPAGSRTTATSSRPAMTAGA